MFSLIEAQFAYFRYTMVMLLAGSIFWWHILYSWQQQKKVSSLRFYLKEKHSKISFCALIFVLSLMTTVAGTGAQALAQLMVDDAYRDSERKEARTSNFNYSSR